MAKVTIASRTSTTPLAVPRTVRNHDITVLTSLPAGRMVPLAAIPLLREDAARVRMNMAVQMMETADLLINEVNISVKAYLVPNLAFDRFQGMDDLNRSYEGKPPRDGLPVIPYIELKAAKAKGTDPILKYLGKHAKPGDMINTGYHEAYNQIWNFRAINRSPDIPKRARLDDTLAPAFWQHERFAHIVPDFDQAIMEGNVALSIVDSKMPVRGIGFAGAANSPATNVAVRTTKQQNETFGAAYQAYGAAGAQPPPTGAQSIYFRSQGGQGTGQWRPDIYAELADTGVTISLANIDLARKTQAFARARQQFNGHDDDYIIDLLMDGLTVPEQAWRQPILLQDRQTIFGMSKRYATNGGDLTESVVNGATMLDLNFAVPRCPTGGVIMIVAECLPGQLFERGRDPYLYTKTVDDLPHALRDMLDPEPVQVVPNGYIDVDHDTPASTFGYAPLNHEWNFASPGIGGRFYRPTVDAPFDEDRQRIWAVETKNPVLSQDFYISRNIHSKPFVNPGQDAFELTARGAAAITGLTQFGPVLVEASDDYKQVMDEAPTQRIVKPPKA